MSRLDLDKPTTDVKRRAKKSSQASIASKLCANADFCKWLGELLEDLCAFEQGFGCHDEFVQGKRAAGSYIVASLRAGGEDFKKAMTGIYAEHFGKQVKQTNQEENR